MFARLSNMFGANDDEEQGRNSPSRKADSKNSNQGGTNPMHSYNAAQCQVNIYAFPSSLACTQVGHTSLF